MTQVSRTVRRSRPTLAVLVAMTWACGTPANAQDSAPQAAFIEKLSAASNQIAQDPSYARIPLETTEDQRWFTDLAYRYWNGGIKRDEFVAQGVAKYPDHRRSFETLADKLAP
jgi:hypothetical protein